MKSLLFVVEIAKLAVDVELLLVAGLYAAHNLRIDAKVLADFDAVVPAV